MSSFKSLAQHPVFSLGFRPFFLAATMWAAVAVAIWLPFLAGTFALPTAFSPIDWHAHELLFGYVPAVIAGFLLTAIPNWTGRPAVSGKLLAALLLLWLAGRLAVLFSALIGPTSAAIADTAFLFALAALAAREIVASKNWRNLRVVALLVLLACAGLAHHVEALRWPGNGYALRSGIGIAVMLVMLIGGRIIPAFTRNWLTRRPPGRLPGDFGWPDRLALTLGGVAILGWIADPAARITAALALLAAIANLIRVARWAGERTLAEPLLAILHFAYVFVPLGFTLVATSALVPHLLVPTGALHAWTAGVLGIMPLAVMSRVALGHTGRPLVADKTAVAIYALGCIAALARVGAGFDIARDMLLDLSALAWVMAFGVFAIAYWPLLTRPRAR